MHAGGPVVGSGAEFVLERINLPMLVLDLGVVGVASPIDERARRIEARVDLNATSRLRQIETIVGRLLDVELVASVCVTRADSWGVQSYLTTCVVELLTGSWTLELSVHGPGGASGPRTLH